MVVLLAKIKKQVPPLGGDVAIYACAAVYAAPPHEVPGAGIPGAIISPVHQDVFSILDELTVISVLKTS